MPQTDQRKLTPERRSEIARMGGLAGGGKRGTRARFTEAQRNKIRSDNLAKGRLVRHQPAPAAPALVIVPASPVQLYRTEKAAFQARQAARLAEAEVVYQAMLEREAAWRKGGRPKLTCGKAQRKRDPANALLEALESVHG